MSAADPGPPSFGLYLPQVNRDYRTLVAFARAAEHCGFSAVWFMDHLMLPGQPGPVLEGWTVATAIAAVTSRIRIGHLVLCDAFRHPLLLASMAATLDHVSDGRLNLGMGWGSSPDELHLLGAADGGATARAARLTESIAIIRAILAGESVDHVGEHFAIHGVRLGPRAVQDHVPLIIGGVSDRTMKLVRQHADWWNCPAMERHRLGELIPGAGEARVCASYSIAVSAQRGGARRDGAGRSSLLVGSAAEIAQVLHADRRLGVEHFIIQLIDPAATPGDVEGFMAEIAPAIT